MVGGWLETDNRAILVQLNLTGTATGTELGNIGTEDQSIFGCDICEYKCKLNIQLKKHMKMKHSNEQKHTYKEYIKEEMDTMRKELKEAFETFADLIGEVIGTFKDDTKENLGTLADTVYKLGEKIVKIETRRKIENAKMKIISKPVVKASAKESMKANPATLASQAPSPPAPPALPTPPVPAQPKLWSTTSGSGWTSSTRSRRPFQSRISTKFIRKPKTLYVADSVGFSVSLREVEKEQNCRIITRHAYSSVNDAKAKWPGGS